MLSIENMKMVIGMQKSCCSENMPIGKKCDGQIKSGSLYMIQCCNGKLVRIPVFVRVYQNCFEHYAIINRDQKYTNSAVYVSLKHCKVYGSDTENEFKLVPQDIEGTNLTFQANKTQDVHDWISALQPVIHSSGSPPKGSMSPTVRRAPLMPPLQESIEEEDDCDSEDEEDQR